MNGNRHGILILGVILILCNMPFAQVSAESDPDSRFSACGSFGFENASIARDIAYGDGVTVAVGTNGLMLTSTGSGHWVKVKTGVSIGLSSIVWSGKEFIAIASRKPVLSLGKWMCWKNVLLRSQDGVRWQDEKLPFDAEINSVSVGDVSIIVVGRNSKAAVIWVKEQNQPWKSTSIDQLEDIVDVVWTGKSYIAIGNGKKWGMAILQSIDGINWSKKEIDGPGWFSRIVNIGANLVAVGAYKNAGAIYYSQDGVSWKRDSVNVPGWLSDIAANDTKLVAVGAKGLIMQKSNGEWSVLQSPVHVNLYGITWTGREFVAVGGAPNLSEPVIINSVDGIEWKEVTSEMGSE